MIQTATHYPTDSNPHEEIGDCVELAHNELPLGGTNPHEAAEQALDAAHDEATGQWRPKWELGQVNGKSGNFIETLPLGFGIKLRIEHVVDEEHRPNYTRAGIEAFRPTFKAGTSRATILRQFLSRVEVMAKMLAQAIDAEGGAS